MRAFFVCLLLAVGLLGCGATDHSPPTVVVYSSVDQVYAEPVLRACGEVHGIDVRAVFDTEETKSTGLLNRLIAEADNPQADVFWSGDPVRPFLLISRGLVSPYISPEAAALPVGLRAADGTWTGLAARARVLLVNTDLVSPELVSPEDMPTSVLDLTSPRWRGRAAIANPLYGTTTMHVAALFTAWGDQRAREYLEALQANGVLIASSNGEVKRLVAAGEVAFGLTDTDDAHQALASGHPVAVVYPDQDGLGTLVMPTSVVLIRNGPHPEAGRRLIDCLLGAETERRLAETAAHMPLRPGVETPAGVQPVEAIRAMEVDYRAIAAAMERIQPWLREWAGL